MTQSDILERVVNAKTGEELMAILASQELKSLDPISVVIVGVGVNLRALTLRTDALEQRIKMLEEKVI